MRGFGHKFVAFAQTTGTRRRAAACGQIIFWIRSTQVIHERLIRLTTSSLPHRPKCRSRLYPISKVCQTLLSGGWSQVACQRPDPNPAEAPRKSRGVTETAKRRPGSITLIVAGPHGTTRPLTGWLRARDVPQRNTRRDRCAEQERGPDLVMRVRHGGSGPGR